jgi:threonine dehydratase
VGVAALLTGRIAGTGPVCALLSGGNIDPTLLIPVMRHGLSLAGRILVIRSRLTDRPGELIKLITVVAQQRANIVAIEHRREGVALQVADVGIELTLITRNEEHCLALIAGIEAAGFPVERQR